MDWTDDGIVLSARRHGESSAIVTLLTAEHGRHGGLVRGGAGKRGRGLLQPGNQVRATWRARLAEHLGTYSCELSHGFAAHLLDDPQRLAGLSAACAVAEASLPERESFPAVYEGLLVFLSSLDGDAWPTVYVKWELGLLGELGFGLDLTQCAATGRNDELAFVSPKTGRAVSLSAAEPYRNLLLTLPPFLLADGQAGTFQEVADGLKLTGFFLERHVFGHRDRRLPAARARLAERLAFSVPDTSC
jgi:DNA repair protein RecO (recombination protein O)